MEAPINELKKIGEMKKTQFFHQFFSRVFEANWEETISLLAEIKEANQEGLLNLARKIKERGEKIGNYGISFFKEIRIDKRLDELFELFPPYFFDFSSSLLPLAKIFYFERGPFSIRKIYQAKLLERINYKSSPFILNIYKVFLKGSEISLKDIGRWKEKKFEGEYWIIKRRVVEKEYANLARKIFLALLKNLKNTAPIILSQSKKLFKIDGKIERVERKFKVMWDELGKEVYIDNFSFYRFVLDFKRVDEKGIIYRIKIPFPYSRNEIRYELEKSSKIEKIRAHFDDEGIEGKVEINLGNERVKVDRRIISAAQTWLYNVAYEESRDYLLDEELKQAENLLLVSK